MSNGYREGYEQGKRDKQAGRRKDMRPPLATAVLKGRRYTNYYMAGYREGYRKG